MSHLNVTAMKTGGAYITKNYGLFLFMLVCTLHHAFGEIKNGYEREITYLRASLRNLKAILDRDSDLSGHQRRRIESTIIETENTISYYELTENQLTQFRTISPSLYAEIDSIKDKRGRPVNVYVKFIPRDETTVKAWGTTYIDQSTMDEDASCSEYGELTVSVKIWLVNKALLVLAHEFGHVKYQVPHLANYIDYYKDHYSLFADPVDLIGHNANDPSGNSASVFEKRFQKDYSSLLRITNERIQDPLVIMNRIRKNLNNNI